MKNILNAGSYLLYSTCFLCLLLSTWSCRNEEISQMHEVAFVSNGGTNMSTLRIGHGEKISLNKIYPEPIVSDGGDFLGWFSDEDFSTPFDFSTPITTDITLYAKWYYESYKISFVMNAGSSFSPVEVRVGREPILPNPSEEGYAFVGWYKDDQFKNLFTTDEPSREDITLFGRFERYSPASWFSVSQNGVLEKCTPAAGTSVVVLPEGITHIPDWFVLANGLNEPGKPGFATGADIREFILPSSLEKIGYGAFKYAAIRSIIIPAKVKELVPITFEGCDHLESVSFEKGSQLERLSGNDSNEPIFVTPALQRIIFPPSLRYVGKYTLAGARSLKTVTFQRKESPVIFDTYLPGGGVWLFGGYFPEKILMPVQVRETFLSEMRKVTGDYEYEKMSGITEGY